MAVSVASYSVDLPVRGWPRRGIRQRKTGLDNAELQRELRSRIKALVGNWVEFRDCNIPRRPYAEKLSIWTEALSAKDVTRRELFRPCGTVKPAVVPPPTYEESLQDLPPDYTDTGAVATVCFTNDAKDSVIRDGDQQFHPDVKDVPGDYDFSELDGIRSYAGKKAKKAAKAVQQAKWMDSDGEENKGEGGEGQDGNGGGDGDGGSGAGGDGGDPPGGGDDDWWNAGNSKKDKKKKKKNAWDVCWLQSDDFGRLDFSANMYV